MFLVDYLTKTGLLRESFENQIHRTVHRNEIRYRFMDGKINIISEMVLINKSMFSTSGRTTS